MAHGSIGGWRCAQCDLRRGIARHFAAELAARSVLCTNKFLASCLHSNMQEAEVACVKDNSHAGSGVV